MPPPSKRNIETKDSHKKTSSTVARQPTYSKSAGNKRNFYDNNNWRDSYRDNYQKHHNKKYNSYHAPNYYGHYSPAEHHNSYNQGMWNNNNQWVKSGSEWGKSGSE